MYRVLRRFEDLQDNRHLYQPGDDFPRAGLKVSEDRIDELSSSKNKRHVPLIKFVPQEIVEPEVDEEIIEKIEETGAEAEAEPIEMAVNTPIQEPEQPKAVESKPKRKRAKKEQ